MSDTENGGGDKRPAAAAAEDSDSEDDMLGRASNYDITAVSPRDQFGGFSLIIIVNGGTLPGKNKVYPSQKRSFYLLKSMLWIQTH
jgi:hypothetical protein